MKFWKNYYQHSFILMCSNLTIDIIIRQGIWLVKLSFMLKTSPEEHPVREVLPSTTVLWIRGELLSSTCFPLDLLHVPI